ncbi:YuzB family protein [Tepidibacillus marianensis]|uniref:YuzB family protein n=1 Tax=Tepidibacillus marianensis TaxID=3131995 RepID=UPI0030CB8C8E
MKPLIEFCRSNYSWGTEQVKEKLEEDPDLEVMEYGCLGHCSQCLLRPFALVEGKFIDAGSPEELLFHIEEKLKEKDPFQDLWDQILKEE